MVAESGGIEPPYPVKDSLGLANRHNYRSVNLPSARKRTRTPDLCVRSAAFWSAKLYEPLKMVPDEGVEPSL